MSTWSGSRFRSARNLVRLGSACFGSARNLARLVSAQLVIWFGLFRHRSEVASVQLDLVRVTIRLSLEPDLLLCGSASKLFSSTCIRFGSEFSFVFLDFVRLGSEFGVRWCDLVRSELFVVSGIHCGYDVSKSSPSML